VPRAALSEDEIQAFRGRAVAAAMELFAEQGYDAVTVRSVARALGVSPMTPYRYFEDKDELFAVVRAEAFRVFGDRQEQAVAGGGSPTDKLVRLQRAYIDHALEHPDAYRVMFELQQPSTDAYPELVEAGGRAFSFLHLTVEEAVEAGLLEGDPLTVAHLLWAQTHGLVTLHLAGKLEPPMDIRTLADAVVAQLSPGGRSQP
jgi:AcrR family transcriptional regulator